MKVRLILAILVVFTAVGFIACDDDMNTVGSGLRPESDSIYIGVDSVYLTAKTISLEDSIYATSGYGVLGKYKDDTFGEIESDYLAEFYWPRNGRFEKNTFSITATQVVLESANFTGDTTQLVGLTAYELNSPLKENYFTNIDPSIYTDLSKPIAQGGYMYQEAPIIYQDNYNRIKGLTLECDTTLGRRFLEAWERNPEILKDSERFREFFSGIYISTTFGEGILAQVSRTMLRIDYKYLGRNNANTKDSVRTSNIQISVTPDVIQLNRVENRIPADLLAHDPNKTYVKTPAGLATEITIPLKEILDKLGSDTRTLNSALFKIKGFTEAEDLAKIKPADKPQYMLFINKDSIENFFTEGRLIDQKSSFIYQSTGASNTYISNWYGDNLAALVSHYRQKVQKENIEIDKLTYILIPVDMQTASSGTGSTIAKVHNSMWNKAAILRTDKKNLKMKLVFSEYVK